MLPQADDEEATGLHGISTALGFFKGEIAIPMKFKGVLVMLKRPWE